MRHIWLFGLFIGCGGEPEAVPALEEDPRTWLTPTEHLVRASMALRGLRPSAEDIETVETDPDQLPQVIDTYLASPEWIETVKDMHAELFLVRNDADTIFLPLGPLEGNDTHALQSAVMEAPLLHIAHVVSEDRPYTDILQGDTVWVNRLSSEVWEVDYDPAGPDWQQARWTDGRPAAGILSDSALFVRHLSDGGNANRGRAEMVANTLLCQSFLTRDVPLDGSIDLADEEAVANAVATDPGCVSCHQALDPLAGPFWPHNPKLTRTNINRAYDEGCTGNRAGDCYPIAHWRPERAAAPSRLGLREPGFYGTAISDVADLSEAIIQDPRFSFCTATRFYSYLTQTRRDEVPHLLSAELQLALLDSGFSAKALARAIVLSDAFRAASTPDPNWPAAGLQTMRPEQHARVIKQLTGFEWVVEGNRPNCVENNNCLGEVDLTITDSLGFRSMAGGVDGVKVTQPAHTPTPIKLLVAQALAEEAAGYAAARELTLPPADRTLFTRLDGSNLNEETLRAQFADLHLTILSERVDPTGPEVDATYALYEAVAGRNGPEVALQTVLAALLQDPHLLTY